MTFRPHIRTAGLTIIALAAFAANSILCRLALGSGVIDAASYATVRLASGAAVLAALALARSGWPRGAGSWISGAMLFLYAIPFSFAYLSLSSGTGALILFAAVQATMISWALRSGERPHVFQWAGLFLAIAGLGYLVRPGLSAPSPLGAALMALAGIAWGIYSLRGRRSHNPLADTTSNFARAAILAVSTSLLAIGSARLSFRGVLLAALSGTIASGAGYAIWYAALAGLSAARAATVQLVVPVLAAAGGVAFLGERISLRLVLASIAILGGVGLAVAGTGTRRKET
jgi:drug/metabolite transporter (DMT)-like permease